MDYAVNRFIVNDLKTSVYAFSKATQTKQQTISNWKMRNKSVGTLPIQLLVDLVAESGLSYEEVINKLMKYEIEYKTDKGWMHSNG